jgi:hypothetical protein
VLEGSTDILPALTGREALEKAVGDWDSDLAKLREQRIAAPFALDRMLPFWALVFNLREVAEALGELMEALREVE